jgi:aspartate/methionine/tyrosine aminotransferase
MSESGIRAVSLRELADLGFNLEAILDMPLGYSQSNGTIELRERLASLYPGSTVDNIEVTNGTSEANYLLSLVTLNAGDVVALQVPNYMQLWGVPQSLGAAVKTFRLAGEEGWGIDWEEFESAVGEGTKLVYVSNPNNPSGHVLTGEDMDRILGRCEDVGAWLLSDEVYIGAEIDRPRTPSFWGRSDRVVVTSGLSKAYGIPGVRIGWIVGPKPLVDECWAQHDYLTIGPSKMSDIIARTAVLYENRETLYCRTQKILRENLPLMDRWIKGFGGFLTYTKPQAGAFCFVKYEGGPPSLEIVQRIRENQSTLIVPGSHLGLEGFLRIWMGASPEFMGEGLRRIGLELGALA